MEHQHKPQNNGEKQEDVRMEMTTRIWGMAVGMLGICIPLCAVTHSNFIPLAVIGGAAVGTIAIWSSRGQTPKTPTLPDTAAQNRIKELEERLANLEVINNYERRLAEEELARQAAIPAPAPAPAPAPVPAPIYTGQMAKDEPGEVTTIYASGVEKTGA